MNKNYRSIWNDALGAWVAVSEIETAKGKPAGSRVCSAKGGASVLKTVLRTIPLVLGMALWPQQLHICKLRGYGYHYNHRSRRY